MRYTNPRLLYFTSLGVAHWSSLSGRPQHWHVKGACATPKEERKKDLSAASIPINLGFGPAKKYTGMCIPVAWLLLLVVHNTTWDGKMSISFRAE